MSCLFGAFRLATVVELQIWEMNGIESERFYLDIHLECHRNTGKFVPEKSQ
jgi:hypothetical protein